MGTRTAIVAAGLVAVLPVRAALACGGLFWPDPPAGEPPAPVDQTTARMVFVVDDDAGRVCNHLSIRYQGAPESFAWVVPVPAEPDVDDSSEEVFDALDRAAAMYVVPPPQDYSACLGSVGDSEPGCGCGGPGGGGDAKSARGGEPGGDLGDAEPPVTVISRTHTDNYEVTVVGTESTQSLVTWLRANDYNYSDNMAPALEAYVQEGQLFAAFKLLAGREATDIAPVVLCYDADGPAIPLRLAAIAAQPYLSIQVDILADETYGPANFVVIKPDGTQLAYDPQTGRTNYFEWVARTVAEGQGHRIVLQWAGTHSIDPYYAPRELVRVPPVLSRYYTRISPEQMDRDPVFQPGAASYDGAIDLSSHPTLDGCAIPVTPPACWDNFCGLGATCLTGPNDANAYCRCADDQLAQRVAGPDGIARVACVPAQNPLGVTDEAAGAGSTLDPCTDYDCGLGRCRHKNGFPACDCEEGAGATVEGAGLVRCATLPADAVEYGPGAGPDTRLPGIDTSALVPRPRGTWAAAPWVALLALSRLRIRRRRA